MATTQTTTAQVPTQQTISGKSRKEKCVNCCKKFIAFLFSTIGLLCLLVAYTVLGSFAFMKLEGSNEKVVQDSVKEYQDLQVQTLWKQNENNDLYFDPEKWKTEAKKVLDNYTRFVYEAITREGWAYEEEGTDSGDQWSFAGAMLYCITVITTIGYGHIAPKTMWGRIVTILYALIGIPLTLLTITNLGGFMATAFRYLYRNICCGLCCVCCSKYDRRASNAGQNNTTEEASGDPNVAKALSMGENTGMLSDIEEERPSNYPPPPKKRPPIRVIWRHGLERMLKTEDTKTVRVPLTVSLLLIFSYIFAGAMLFKFWEKDWDMLIGAYFCFITLTTIGFGDYVPGTSVDSWDNQEKLILCSLYLLLGLSLIAMCFDLMQEEVRNKCRALGRKLGLLPPDPNAAEKRKKKQRQKSKSARSRKKQSRNTKKRKDKDLKSEGIISYIDETEKRDKPNAFKSNDKSTMNNKKHANSKKPIRMEAQNHGDRSGRWEPEVEAEESPIFTLKRALEDTEMPPDPVRVNVPDEPQIVIKRAYNSLERASTQPSSRSADGVKNSSTTHSVPEISSSNDTHARQMSPGGDGVARSLENLEREFLDLANSMVV